MKLMAEGRFILRKWSSSVPAVLEALPENLRESQLPLNFDTDDSVKTLGLFWMPASDEFKFYVQQPDHEAVTKRGILSQIAKVFDPLGLISTATICGNLLMQTLENGNRIGRCFEG
ncbi:unnamed protein product [Allacma fusca]|uniref:Uncharacterized protein n=1 Tax=Allacma fusca TaxID=39272 RepID=A0A8J2NPA7_9HEXA|nr:unnamed protein product [Allacma fusca]